MSTIKGTNVNAPIVPFDTNDIFASHMAKYGHGGWRTAEDLNERDAIKELRREDLMVCAVREDSYNNSTRGDAFYILDVKHDASTSTSLLDNNNWIPLEFGGDEKHWVLPPPPRSLYPGNQGERSYDEDFIYICILDNVWKRVAFDFFEDGFVGSTSGGTAGYLADGVVPIWCGDQWCYNLVVSDVESTSGAGTDGEIDLLITFTDGSQKLIPLGVEEHWTFPVPTSTYFPGNMGDRSYDDNFFYICIQDNIWKRVSFDFFLFTGSTSGTSGGSLSLPNGVVPIWNNINNSFDYELVVSDIETTSGTAGNVLITYTDSTQKLLAIFSGQSGTSGGTIDFLDDIGDVTITTPLVNHVLTYNGSNWVNLPNSGSSGNSGLDYTTAGLASSSWVTNNFVDINNFNNATTGINNTLIDLQNQINNSTSGVSILDDLTDVTITTPSDNQFLRYTGSEWVNETVVINDYTTAGLASSSWVINNFVDNDTFSSSTQGIQDQLDLLSNIDSLKAPDAYSPNGSYPTTYYGSAIEAGDTWRITTNGTMGTVVVNQEDLLIALADLPAQTDSNFMTVESNRDQATESFMGVAKIATNADVTTGTNDTNFVTPLKLQNKLNSFPDYTTAGLSGEIYTAIATTTITSAGAILTPTTLYNGTAIGSNTIPANTLQVGDTIKTKLRGYLNVSVTGVFAFDVQLSGTSLGSASSIVIAHPKTNTLIELDFEITVRSIGATGSVIGQGVIHISLGSVATPAMVQLVKTTTTTIDTTTTNLLDYLIDWDAGFTGNVNITNAIIEK